MRCIEKSVPQAVGFQINRLGEHVVNGQITSRSEPVSEQLSSDESYHFVIPVRFLFNFERYFSFLRYLRLRFSSSSDNSVSVLESGESRSNPRALLLLSLIFVFRFGLRRRSFSKLYEPSPPGSAPLGPCLGLSVGLGRYIYPGPSST